MQPSENAVRRVILPLVAVGVLLWQSAFFLDRESPLPATYSIERVTGGGGHILAAFQKFHTFFQYTGHFPVASLATDPPTDANALPAWLEAHGSSLVTEIHDAVRSGDVGKIYLLEPSGWFDTTAATPGYRTANFLFFVSGLLVFLIAYGLHGQLLFATLTVIFVGSSSFQLYETYGNENIFSWPIAVFLWVAGLNAGTLRGSWKKTYPLLAILSGFLMACMRQIRPEPGMLVITFALLYLFNTRRSRRQRILLAGLLALSFAATNFLWQRHFENQYRQSAAFVTAQGGHPYLGPRPRHHLFWHPFYCGLGDFGQDRGYAWNDFNAYAYALPILRQRLNNPSLWESFGQKAGLDSYFMDETFDEAKRYPKKLEDIPGYEDILRDKVISDIAGDPLWYLKILLRRTGVLLFDTNGLQLSIPRYYLDLQLPVLGLATVAAAVVAGFRRHPEILFLILASLSVALPTIVISSMLKTQFYSIAHILATAWLLNLAIMRGIRYATTSASHVESQLRLSERDVASK